MGDVRIEIIDVRCIYQTEFISASYYRQSE